MYSLVVATNPLSASGPFRGMLAKRIQVRPRQTQALFIASQIGQEPAGGHVALDQHAAERVDAARAELAAAGLNR